MRAHAAETCRLIRQHWTSRNLLNPTQIVPMHACPILGKVWQSCPMLPNPLQLRRMHARFGQDWAALGTISVTIVIDQAAVAGCCNSRETACYSPSIAALHAAHSSANDAAATRAGCAVNAA
jgi:hypothetical protein